MFLCNFAYARPSRTIPSASRLTTSALMGPSTMSRISFNTSTKSRPSFATRDGLVVTPLRIPMSAAARISPTLAVSMNSFTPFTPVRCWPRVSLRPNAEQRAHVVWRGYRTVQFPGNPSHPLDQLSVAFGQFPLTIIDIVFKANPNMSTEDHRERPHRQLVPAHASDRPGGALWQTVHAA